MRVIVAGRIGTRVQSSILAVAAHVEHDHVERAEKPAPEIEIAVDAEAVAMADQQPRRVPGAMTAQPKPRAVVADHLDDGVRRRDRQAHPAGYKRRRLAGRLSASGGIAD